MVSCPSCGASVSADFGMVTCTACDSVFMIEIDGSVTQPSDEPQPEADSYEASADEPLSYEESSPAATEDYSSVAPVEEQASDEESLEMSSQEMRDEVPAEDEAPQESEYSEDFLHSLDGDDPAEDEPEDPKDPLGVTRFDGAEASQLVDGPYYYDVRVQGIDTAVLKQQVVELLSDKRLNWSPEEIKKMIKMGQLTLENLNPVRAVLVVLKLQALDVDIEWDQRPYTADNEKPQDQET